MLQILALGIIVLLLYVYSTRNFNYWKRKGIQHDPPIPFAGNHFRSFIQKISMSEIYMEQYRKYPQEKMVGFYMGNDRVLILRDPELIKRVMVTDFDYFYPRGINIYKEPLEPLMKNLFTVDGDIWKLLRRRLTPAFTSGKLKAMFPLIVERTNKLQTIAADAAETGKEVDVRDLMARYTTDFIGACGFGIDADALADEHSTFRKLGRRIFTITKRDIFVIICKVLSPELFKSVHTFAPEIENDTIALVKNIMQQRNYKVAGRNDFIDLLLELKDKGKIIGESIQKKNSDGTSKIVELELDDLLMAAQVFIFFAAGFETSSSTSSFTLHQLAFHPEEQRKCQNEIDEVLTRYNGQLCYEAVKEMKYLEMAFRESMRMYPPLGFISRKCAGKYTIPETNLTIDEDVYMIIPVQALHNDEKYFPEPEKFKPERFHADNINKIQKFTYLPFGEGPRACIGERLGLMQSMAGLAALLSKFTVMPSKNTLRRPITDPSSLVVQTIKGGVPLQLVSRRKP